MFDLQIDKKKKKKMSSMNKSCEKKQQQHILKIFAKSPSTEWS